MFTQPFHDFDTHNAFLSQGGALAVVVEDFHETPHRTRDNTEFPRPLRTREARLHLACLPLARRNGAPYERGAGGETPLMQLDSVLIRGAEPRKAVPSARFGVVRRRPATPFPGRNTGRA